MSEEYYCLLGRCPKIFSYINDGKYVRVVCKLKDDIDCFQLSQFFNMMYSLKLESWDVDFCNTYFNTFDLIKCFRMFLRENDVINLKELCYLIKEFDVSGKYSILMIIRQFLEMFEIVEQNVVSLNDEHYINFLVLNSSNVFYKEVESIFYNSMVIDYIYKDRKSKVRKQSYVI